MNNKAVGSHNSIRCSGLLGMVVSIKFESLEAEVC